MAYTPTLQSPQPKQERLNPRQVIGGTFENIFETILDTGPGYLNEVNEGPVSIEDLHQTRKIEGLSGFQTPRGKEQTYARVRESNIQAAVSSENRIEGIKDFLTKKRVEVNSAIGIGNVLYEDTVNGDGSLRIDVQVEMDKKNSEMAHNEVKTNREEMLAQATGKTAGGFTMGENEMLKGGENDQHFTKHVG